MTDRRHDLVLFGATGFTGALTAAYLAGHAPGSLRWALAGRSRDKLEATRERLAVDHPPAGEAELVVADVADPGSLRDVAASARVVATTVGPYVHLGEPLVAACAREGTDYLDLTGEPEFVDRVWLDHHETARSTGARLVHACGFDSIPHDLGALFTADRLPDGVPLRLRGFVRASGALSGGTFHSAVTQFSRARHLAAAHVQRRRREPRPEGRRVHLERGTPYHERAVDAWALPMPTIDPQVIARSASALDRYGPDFTYGHYVAIRRLPVAVGLGAGIGAVFALAQLPPTKALLLRAKAAGSGPSEEQIGKGWFNVRFVGEGGGRRVVCDVAGGDPGYGETSKMLAEAALCLALDDVPSTAGQVTTAAAMGDALTARLRRAGIAFEVVEEGAG